MAITPSADARVAIIALRDVVKDYRGLRPLRVRSLVVREGEIVSVLGFGAVEAEVMVGLATGGVLPDQGEIAIFGEPTTAIDTPERWLDSLDRIGLVSCRTVLVDELSVAQNIAVPLTLDLEPIAEPVRLEICRLAADTGIDAASRDRRVGDVPAEVRARVHLARALALKPRLLLLEHATATLDPGGAAAFGAVVSRLAQARGLSVLALTTDERFSASLGGRRMSWAAATGDVRGVRGWARWF